MKVKELIEQLQKLDQEQTVLAICEDDDLAGRGNGVEFFHANSVSVVRATSRRIEVGEVGFTFGDGPEARDFVFIELDYKF